MKLKFFRNLSGKIEICFTRSHDPQISNQIDAAGPKDYDDDDDDARQRPQLSQMQLWITRIMMEK